MRTTIVVPVFNEEKRLRVGELGPLLARGQLLFADNGSTDGTARLLEEFCRREARAKLCSLPGAGGKAEAVRQGMRAALADGAEVTGYYDADMATPPAEMARVIEAVERGAQVALGTRLVRPGARIERPFVRRVLGRIFAALASRTLGLRIRDTQCGAKAFRAGPALDRALERPFSARWAFDVELIGRLVQAGTPAGGIVEVLLAEWRDVAGSKLRPSDFPRMGLELLRIRSALARQR